jgi:hypothetical protein
VDVMPWWCVLDHCRPHSYHGEHPMDLEPLEEVV